MTQDLLQGTTEEDNFEIDPNKDYLAELVGDNKKFKDIKDLARGKYEADQYIEIMKKRQDELRTDYLKMREENTTRAKLEELIDQLQKKQLASNEHTPVKEDDKPPFDPSTLDSLVSTKIQENETNKRHQSNFDLVKEKLQQRFGTKYKEAVKQQIDELGITEAELNDMAKRQPKVLIKTLGLDQEPERDSFQSPPRSSQRKDTFAPVGAAKRTWAYYQDLKQKNPNIYFDRKTAIQMHNDAIELGEAFRDGDYYVRGLHDN